MVYKKLDNGSFLVESRSKGGASWTVSEQMSSCNCPKYKFILRGTAPCHHIEEVIMREKEKISALGDNAFSGYKKYIAEKYVEVLKIDQFITLYGDEQLEHLKGTFEVFEDGIQIRKL